MQITNIVDTLDRFQQRHPFVGLPYAIIKKFGDDDGGYQAALITYYGFLSIFPLLLVILTVIQLVFHNNPHVRDEVSQSIGHFFPGIGSALQSSVHTKGGTGVGLAIGLLVTIYGSRGVADVLRHTINDIWQVPRMRRTGFPKGMLQSLLIMAAATIGFAATVAVSSFSAVLGHAQWVKIAANVIGFAVLFGVLLFVFRTASSRKVPYKDMLLGTGSAAAIIQFLLTFGSVLIARQLKNFDTLYGTFAIVLGMLFWIYLLAQVVVYAAEIDSVRHLKLWPRAIQNDKPTPQDLHAYELYAHVDRYIPKEEIDIRFK
ncbi:MAG: YihY/virulence factor BrkB family protein [Candidatus Saccharibacteria bacterium]